MRSAPAAEVEFRAGDAAAAEQQASLAEAEARATNDRAALADALGLRAAARVPPDRSRLASTVELFVDICDPIGAARATLAIALLEGDGERAADIRRQLVEIGVAPDVGLPRLLNLGGHTRLEVEICGLGRFAVLRSGAPVPSAAWQSRKARV